MRPIIFTSAAGVRSARVPPHAITGWRPRQIQLPGPGNLVHAGSEISVLPSGTFLVLESPAQVDWLYEQATAAPGAVPYGSGPLGALSVAIDAAALPAEAPASTIAG